MDIIHRSNSSKEYTLGGFAAVSGSHIGWGISDVLVNMIGRGQVATWVHGLTGVLLLFIMMLVLKEKINFKHFWKSFPLGLQRSLTWGAIFIAFQEDNPTIAIAVLSFSLVISIVVFGPMLGEKLTPRILSLSLLGVVGLIMTSLNSLDSFAFSKGALIAFIALPLASAGTYMVRNVQKSVPSKTVAFYLYLWVSILFTPVMLFVNPRFGFTNTELLIILCMAILGAGGHMSFNYSQKRTSFRFNAIASTIHTPVTAIFAWWLLGENLKPHQMFGIVIVTGVVAYMSLSTRSKKVQEFEKNLGPQI